MDRILTLILGVILLFPGACAIYFIFEYRPLISSIFSDAYGMIAGAIWLVSFAISFVGLVIIAKSFDS